MKHGLLITISIVGVTMSGCGVSKYAVKDTCHAVNGSAEVAKRELTLCKKHDSNACDNVEKKLEAIITKSNELDALAK